MRDIGNSMEVLENSLIIHAATLRQHLLRFYP